MRIETARNMDASALAIIHAQGFDKGWPEEDFMAHIKSNTDDVLIIKGTQVLGFIILRTLGADSEILTISVHEDYQNQGVGRKLVKAGLDRARKRGGQTVFLDVAADNPGAICLYESAGFHRYGTRPGYYRRQNGRVDAYLFQKRIPCTSPE